MVFKFELRYGIQVVQKDLCQCHLYITKIVMVLYSVMIFVIKVHLITLINGGIRSKNMGEKIVK